jgi:hypothetical protein
MTPVPEPAEWISRALTHRRGSSTAPAHRDPPSLSRKKGSEHSNLRSILKRVLSPLYRLIRPLVRPPLWRLRTFMTEAHRPERDLLAGLAARLLGLEADIHRISSMQAQLREELDEMRDELNSQLELIQHQLAKDQSQMPPSRTAKTVAR